MPDRRPTGRARGMTPVTTAAGAAEALDPETAARRYAAGVDMAAELVLIDIQDWGAATLRTAKFRQRSSGIDIYGTLITVQLDGANQVLGLTGEFAPEPAVSPNPRRTEAECLKRAASAAGYRGRCEAGRTRLNYYYDGGRWRLAYIFQDIRRAAGARGGVPHVADYVVDAHTGALVDTLPRVKHAAAEMIEAVDETGALRKVAAMRGSDGVLTLHDPELNVQTFDFDFQDILRRRSRLPGKPFPPPGWTAGAIGAHANLSRAARFLKEILGRNSYDDKGSAIIASLNLRHAGKYVANAFWDPSLKQILLGQQEVSGAWKSYGMALDIVAHEVFHGVTDTTARLEYLAMPGALSESYADIFGVLLNNFDKPDPAEWNWEIAEELGEAKRDLSNPARTGDPAHMSDYRDLPLSRDNGGIHANSAIHNRAFHAIATAKRPGGQSWFDARTLALIFYHAMVAHLSRTSTFLDSRNAVLLVAAVYLRDDPEREARLQAVREAFDQAGIG
ncbi:MAG: M4 family metallopeptidase [Bryobacteraceae bacterium]|nr:M4 family metallopeptidase [Bryobacteraceae bacterium]